MIKDLHVFKEHASGILHGIHKAYFPRAKVWQLLEEGANSGDLEVEAVEFYKVHFMQALKLDQLESQRMQFICLNFATMHGKKKLLQKLGKVTGMYGEDLGLVQVLNTMGAQGELELMIELLEFYHYIGASVGAGDWILREYTSRSNY